MELDIETLLTRYRDGRCTADERVVVERFLLDHAATSGPTLSRSARWSLDRRIRDRVQQVTGVALEVNTFKRLWQIHRLSFAAAASVILISSLVILVFREKTPSAVVFAGSQTIKAGSNQAVLTLANGKRVMLSGKSEADTIRQPGTLLTVTPAGLLTYRSPKTGVTEVLVNSVETAAGGQWQLILQDGTRVWLNSRTKISYPTVFNAKERQVKLDGEAYFEVSRDEKRPFIVTSGTQRLRVLGTHFNISAYPEDKIIKSTLLSGSVMITDTVTRADALLKPGMQAALYSGTVSVKKVEADDAIDWQRGLFVFDSAELGEVMRKLSRWYGCRIIFENTADARIRIGGSVSRSASIGKVLEKVSAVGHVRFEVRENEVKVISNN
ncbi:FecR domain-containing protein [Mucilaginibacter celer]|uniref:DUF4974 domain-containing protein n=1 Tax=Mucilaginibacter celer TaxID=2305508 RepID=A0A494VSL9_9SPHI|nr:FecR domain-containing protein [Mucilaginibacter celer]AYL94353.1 DUF4974 domain-containing protein [Mucilaginibacter celer]